jgi:hypothetical protein
MVQLGLFIYELASFTIYQANSTITASLPSISASSTQRAATVAAPCVLLLPIQISPNDHSRYHPPF